MRASSFIEQNSAFNLTCDLFVEAIFVMLRSFALNFLCRTSFDLTASIFCNYYLLRLNVAIKETM